MPPGIPSTSRNGQALAELVIALLTLVILVIGVTALSNIAVTQLTLRREVRLEAGTAALRRATAGWSDTEHTPEHRSAPEHRINAYARLEKFSPGLPSRLPASNFTLSARDLPENELGLRETEAAETVQLDDAFISLIYGKPTLRLTEKLTFPATTGLDGRENPSAP